MENDPYLDPLALVLEAQYPKHGLIERARSLDDIVVHVVDGGIDRDSRHEVGVADAGPCPRDFRRGECSPVGEDMHGGLREPIAGLAQQADKALPSKQWLAAGEPDESCTRVDEREGRLDLIK